MSTKILVVDDEPDALELVEFVEHLVDDLSTTGLVHEDPAQAHLKHGALKVLGEVVSCGRVVVQAGVDHIEDLGGHATIEAVVDLVAFPRG